MLYRRSRIVARWAAALAMAGAVGLASPGDAGARQATGAPPAYTIGLTALMNAANVTEVIVTVKPASPSFVLPKVAKQILLRSYAADGITVFWAKTYSNVPLDAQGRARFTYTGLSRYQPLRALVTIQTAQMVNAQVYRGDSRVLLRPDLEVQSASAPSQAMVYQPVAIQASIHERNGDVGAVCTVVLLDAANTVLDSAAGVSVSAGGTVAVVLTAQFATPGTYSLTVEIRNSNPTEYDAANDLNNRKSVTIVIVGTIPTEYNLSYSDYTFTQRSTYREQDFLRTYLRYASTYCLDGEWENFGYSAWFYTPLSSAGFSVDIRADGAPVLTESISVGPPTGTSNYDDGMGNTLDEIFYVLPLGQTGTDYLYFYARSGTGIYAGSNFSSLQVQHYAYDYVYFSLRFDYLFGTFIDSGAPSAGAFWRARTTVHTDIRVVASDGTQYGGQTDTALDPSQYDLGPTLKIDASDVYDYYREFFDEVHQRQWYGFSSGTTY